MNKLNKLNLAFAFTGSFIGAGFVSGQELWQFFASFGVLGYIGFAFAIALLSLISYILLCFSYKSGIVEIDRVIFPNGSKALRATVSAIEISFLIGIYIIMASGAGALVSQMFEINFLKFVSSIAFCIIVTIIAMKGTEGAVSLFSKLVPALTVVTILISIIALAVFGVKVPIKAVEGNPLINNPLIAAITFVSYNFFCAIGVIANIGKMVNTKKTMLWGTVIGGIILFVIGFGIMLALSTTPVSFREELPMLYLTKQLGTPFMYLYAILLIGSMMGAALAVFIPVIDYFLRFEKIKSHKNLFIWLLSSLTAVFSIFGFSDLVGIIYPIYGYIAIAAIVMIIINYVQIKKNDL